MREFVVGRSAQAGVVISHDTVSGSHLKVTVQPGRISVMDMGSTNGTRLLGTSARTLDSNVVYDIQPDALLELGQFQVSLLSLINQFNSGGGGSVRPSVEPKTAPKQTNQNGGISRYIRNDDGTFKEND